MSLSAMTLTASITLPSGVVVKSVLPLMRRISLTSMAPPLPYCVTRVLLVDDARQPEPYRREHVQENQRDELDAHERHHARKDRVEGHVGRRHALQIERGHRDRP